MPKGSNAAGVSGSGLRRMGVFGWMVGRVIVKNLSLLFSRAVGRQIFSNVVVMQRG